MDQWIIIFIVLSVVLFLISFSVPRLAFRGPKKKKRSSSPLPSKAQDFRIPAPEPMVDGLDEWEVGAPKERKLDDMSFKGLRIAWKQFNSELDALIKETVSTAHIEPQHTTKLNELESFFNSSLKGHMEVLSDQDQKIIIDKIARAKRLIQRY